MIWIELAILFALFFGICFMNTGSDEKNLKSYSSYPTAVQKMIDARTEWKDKIPHVSAAASFVSNLILFGVLLFVMGIFVRKSNWMTNVLNLSILGQGVNLFDFLVIDALWFRHTKRARFRGTEDDDALYSGLENHAKAFGRAVVMFAVIALVDGFLLTLF